jgi:hypothetical protein
LNKRRLTSASPFDGVITQRAIDNASVQSGSTFMFTLMHRF